MSILIQASHHFPSTPGHFQPTSTKSLWNEARQMLNLHVDIPSAQFQVFLSVNNCFGYYIWLVHSDKSASLTIKTISETKLGSVKILIRNLFQVTSHFALIVISIYFLSVPHQSPVWKVYASYVDKQFCFFLLFFFYKSVVCWANKFPWHNVEGLRAVHTFHSLARVACSFIPPRKADTPTCC